MQGKRFAAAYSGVDQQLEQWRVPARLRRKQQ
jgi:hypothetical protein